MTLTAVDTNAYLNQTDMTTNAQIIANFFIGLGWTSNAIAGMLGNMQHESTINFGIYESLDNTSTTNGFGLVQWTPNTVYFNWADANGYTNDHVNGELYRIKYELDNNVQWISTSTYPMTFQQFTQSTDTADNLASAWMDNYERPAPATADEADRRTYALNWYSSLDWSGSGTGGTGGGGTGGTGGTTSSSSSHMKKVVTLLLADTLNGWKW